MKLGLLKKKQGFTLIEVMVVMVISGIILGVIVNIFVNNRKVIQRIDSIDKMRSNARGVIFILEDNIRMAGFDPLQEISSFAVVTAESGVFEFVKKNDEDLSDIDDVRIALNREGDCGYSGCNSFDGIVKDTIGATSIVVNSQNAADNIAALRFCYAYDLDNDGYLETSGNNIIWAVDSNGDKYLDLSLDSNNDGEINGSDTPTALSAVVPISKIRAVKVMVVARTQHRTDTVNTKSFFLGADSSGNNLEYTPPDSDYGYYFVSTIVRCRNLGG